jgi:hypothetical protein
MKNAKIIRELKRIAEANHGLLLPERVVDAARPKTSPLHKRFEWDDTIAGQAHRLWQARQLISICVTVVSNDSEPVQVFTSLSTDRGRGGGYRTTVEVCSNAELRQQMLDDALHDLNGFQRRYSRLRELAEVFAAAAKVKAKRKAA